MAVDAIALPGAPPLAAGPPEAQASPGASSGDGRAFSDVIASALEQPTVPADGAPLAVEVVVPQMPGIDFAALVVSGRAPAEGTQNPVPITQELRPDRDAEAEDAAAALAAFMLGGVLPRPTAAVAMTAGGVASAPAVTVGVAAASLALTGTSTDEVVSMPVTSPIDAQANAAVPQEPIAVPVSEYGWRPVVPTTVSVSEAALALPKPDAEVAPVSSAAIAVPASPTPAASVAADPMQASASSEQASEVVSSAAPASEPIAEQPLERAGDRPAPEHIDATPTSAPYAATQVEVRAPEVAEVRPTLTVDATDGPRLASRVADSVQAATLTGDRELRIALNPPDLGQLTVHITEHAQGGVTVAIHASSAEAHDLLQQQLPALRAGLEQREVRVERLQVEQQAPSAGLGWADSGQQRSNGGRDAWASRDEQSWSPIAAMGGVRSNAAVSSRGSTEAGRVDLRA